MGVLDRFERRIETLVEGAFAKAFRAHVQPVEIARALERELDDRAAIVGARRTLVPNTFHVELAAADAERLGSFRAVLAGELATSVKEHAAEHHYSFMGPVDVGFTTVDALDTGVFRVRSEVTAGSGSEYAPTAAAAGSRLEDTVAGTTYPLIGPLIVLGRGAEAGIRVEDSGVSRKHAELRLVDDAAHELVDLGSTNGSYVNGTRVVRQLLADGDRLEFGAVVLVYRTSVG